MTEPYKYQSLADAYESIYEGARTSMALNGVHKSADAYHKPEQNDRAATSYAKARDKKMADRKASTLKVEAADLAYVINALIEDGTITPERVKEIMTEKLETGDEYHARMKEKNKEPINKYPFKNKDRKQTVRRNVAPPKDTRTDAQKMADAYASPRKGLFGATRAD